MENLKTQEQDKGPRRWLGKITRRKVVNNIRRSTEVKWRKGMLDSSTIKWNILVKNHITWLIIQWIDNGTRRKPLMVMNTEITNNVDFREIRRWENVFYLDVYIIVRIKVN